MIRLRLPALLACTGLPAALGAVGGPAAARARPARPDGTLASPAPHCLGRVRVGTPQ